MRALRPLAALALALCATLLLACGDEDEPQTTEAAAAGDCREVEPPAPKQASFQKPDQVLERGQRAVATVETSCGSFKIELDTRRSPQTANSFAFLAEQGFYDDTVFHRIAPGFVIQGGDPQGADPQVAGSGGSGYTVREPPPQRTTYERGVVAMAKTEVEPPGASGSQFFIVTAPADAGLPPDYAVAGRVSEGIEVVEAIGELGDPATEQPLQTVTIDTITVATG